MLSDGTQSHDVVPKFERGKSRKGVVQLYEWNFLKMCSLSLPRKDWDFSPTAECYWVFAQCRFRCVLGELGRFREEPGSGNHSMGSDGLGSVPEVWAEPVLGTGFREPKV